MKVVSVTLAGALLLLISALPQQTRARAASGLNPQHILNNRHQHSRRSGGGGSDASALRGRHPLFTDGVLAQPHSRGHLHQHPDDDDVEEIQKNLPDDADDEEEEEEEDEDDDPDFEWSSEDLDMIKKKILDGLGLTTPPQRSQANVTKDEYDQAYTEYLRLVKEEEERDYDDDDDDDEDDDDDDDGKDEDEKDEDEGPRSTAFRFYSTGVSQHSRRGRRSAGVEGQVVHFHVAVPVRRVYRQDQDVKQATCRLWKTGGAGTAAAANTTVTVSIYQLSQTGRRRRRRKQEPRPVLIQALNVSVTGDEWLSVDVTRAVRGWVRSPREDAGVLVRCPDCAAAGVTIHTGPTASNTTHVPTLDVVTELPAGRRSKRSPEMTQVTRAKWRPRGDCRDINPNPSGRRRRSYCCRRNMRVRFKDLPEFEFIESPNEFNAYYCSGRCPPRYNPANEHALLQSLLKLQHKKNIPRPCCAPTALKGLHILHLNTEGKLTTTYWDDMIVTECGCA